MYSVTEFIIDGVGGLLETPDSYYFHFGRSGSVIQVEVSKEKIRDNSGNIMLVYHIGDFARLSCLNNNIWFFNDGVGDHQVEVEIIEWDEREIIASLVYPG